MKNNKSKKLWKILKLYIKMVKAVIKFGYIEIKKQKCHQHKKPILMDNIDNNKIAVFNKISFGKDKFKYFIDYKDAKKVGSFLMFLPKMSAYKRDYDKK